MYPLDEQSLEFNFSLRSLNIISFGNFLIWLGSNGGSVFFLFFLCSYSSAALITSSSISTNLFLISSPNSLFKFFPHSIIFKIFKFGNFNFSDILFANVVLPEVGGPHIKTFTDFNPLYKLNSFLNIS